MSRVSQLCPPSSPGASAMSEQSSAIKPYHAVADHPQLLATDDGASFRVKRPFPKDIQCLNGLFEFSGGFWRFVFKHGFVLWHPTSHQEGIQHKQACVPERLVPPEVK